MFLSTVKLIYFGTPENFAVISLKIRIERSFHRVICPKDANGMENSQDPDQT